MKLDYSLKVYNKEWRLVRVIAIPKSAQSALNEIIRLPSKVALETFYSLAFPVLKQDFALVEAAIGDKLNPKKDHYVLEVSRHGRV